MNRRIVFSTVGQIIKIEAVLLILPLLVSLYYKEFSIAVAFAITIGIALAVGFLLKLIFKPYSQIIYAKEGFVIVALAWILLSMIGALPFVIGGEIPSYVDAFFETVSGFTTTGASILNDVEAMSHGALFWRSFTHWIGGMGVLVFVAAIVSNFTDRSIHIIRAEMPGPIIGKLLPRTKDTAKILYLIYIALTIVEVIFLLAGGMSVFDSVVHTFGTAGTGGFGIKADSIAGYSNYLQWVITIFMALFGINFNIYYLVLLKKFKLIFKSTEMWCYIGIIAVSTMLIACNIMPIYNNIADALRLSAFQVSSIITTTGYSTADFNLWPEFSKTIIILLMFIGACAGSTGGGFKVSRIVILFKFIKKEIQKLINPKAVTSVKFEGKNLNAQTLSSVTAYMPIYIVCFCIILLILSLEPANFDFTSNFSAAASCFNNIGPGLGAVGPLSSFAGYSDLSKIVLSFAMLLGRLEIMPIIIALSPATWVRR